MTDLNQEALRAARERDTAIELCALLGLQPQKVDGGGVALWEEYLPHARALLRLADRTRPAPSQTAVEPVAGELEILLQWLPKLIAVLGSKPEHVDDVARLARMHALIPEQTAAREAAEKERDEAQGFVERLQAALFFWMPGVRPETDTGLARSAGDDAYLLSGYSGPELGPCWGDDILATVATLKARVAELEADRDQAQRNRDMWKAQCERQAAQATTNTDFLDFVVRRTWDNPLSAEEALSAIQWHPTLKAFYERSRIDPRRLTHQEKNNG